MSAAKTELKMAVLHDQGVKADDQLDAATRRMCGHDGAKQALRGLAKMISGLAEFVDRDVEAGKIPSEPLEVAKYAKLMIDRAVQAAIGQGQHQENCQLSAAGEIGAYKAMVESLQKEHAQEAAKLAAIQQAVADGRLIIEGAEPSQRDDVELAPRERPIGVRPAAGIAAQRKAEAATPKNGKSRKRKGGDGAHA